MDTDSFKNYRPVSNLQFIGKLVERIVKIRLNKYMADNSLHSDFQHEYKSGHSTETLLLKVVNDLLLACDKQLSSILILIDLSTAFNTVDQTTLLTILRDEIGIEGTALKWFAPFLKGRTQRVKISDSYSEESAVIFWCCTGIGSWTGPVHHPTSYHFRKYIKPTRFSIFGFADNHRLLKIFLPIFQVNALDGGINK